MRSFQQAFDARIEELFLSSDGPTAYFFKGFPPAQVQHILSHPQRILDCPDLMTHGMLDLSAMEENARPLLTALLTAQSTVVGIYEQLISLCSMAQHVGSLFQGTIVVVENNLFPSWVPSCLPPQQANALFERIRSEQNVKDNTTQLIDKYYGDAMPVASDHILLSPRNVHQDEGLRCIDFWDQCNPPQDCPGGIELHIGTEQDWNFRFLLMEDGGRPVHLTWEFGKEPASSQGLKQTLSCLDIPFSECPIDTRISSTKYDPHRFLPLLQTYWGSEAAFRDLSFYENPLRSKETKLLSQGTIISEIVDQCERAYRGESNYRDVFITAPTGAGKSLLFQLPALHLAQEYGLVTVVISPLIALMNDQVAQLESQHGITCATCINSSLSYEERLERIRDIQSGDKSILYMAPELLLSTKLSAFLGGRGLGLLVIDEAHTVTSWGRDFRSDYWFLGDFLKTTKRDGLTFPVLCLTATAVYSGADDVVNDTIAELDLNDPVVHLGNVKRENIEFNIAQHSPSDYPDPVELTKESMVLEQLQEYVRRQEKTLVYCPYRSQVETLYNKLPHATRQQVRRYHGQVPTPERKLTEHSYRNGEVCALVCTKAFGMGIDVKDIKHIIHFAPTGTLSDYVQEIGRAARDKEMVGIAHIDYFPSDIRYVRVLNGLSEMRQYQLREMLRKLSDIYQAKGKRNLLIAPDTFSYLFREQELENKVKNGLLLLAKDLKYKYSFPVLIVRPKAMLTKNYVNVPYELEPAFLAQYGPYAQKLVAGGKRTIPSRDGVRASDVTVTNNGTIYLVDMSELWEQCFPNMTFGIFKQHFFSPDLLKNRHETKLSPRIRITLNYNMDFSDALDAMTRVVTAIKEIMESHKRGQSKTFTAQVFEQELTQLLGEPVIEHSKFGLLMDIFTMATDENATFSQSRSQIKVLQKRKQPNRDETVYFVNSGYYSRLLDTFQSMLYQCTPSEEGVYQSFLPSGQRSSIALMPLLKLLELLNIASYEIRGGEKLELFLRINDPDKIKRLSQGDYRNAILQDIRKKHQKSQAMLSAFFQIEMTGKARWSLIEDYFLGREEQVNALLGLEE